MINTKVFAETERDLELLTVCPFCGEMTTVLVNKDDYVEWLNGALIQNVFPYLSADERERLISDICPSCWDKMFSEDEEEEEEDYEPDYDECGYDPYIGCYDFDC